MPTQLAGSSRDDDQLMSCDRQSHDKLSKHFSSRASQT